MMQELLLIGGPRHGEVVQVENNAEVIRAAMPENMQARDGETGLPLLGFREVTYTVRKLLTRMPNQRGAMRKILAEQSMSDQQAIEMLGQYLVSQFILARPDELEPVR